MRKSKLLLLPGTALVAILMMFMAACHKKASPPPDTSFTTDQATADKCFEDAETAADAAAATMNGNYAYFRTSGMGSNCAFVNRQINVANNGYMGDSVLYIQYGATGCTCLDQSSRQGLISVYYNGSYFDSGTVVYITFTNYYQNGNSVAGVKTVTNMGTNAAGQRYFDVSVNGSVTLANGAGTLNVTSNRVRTWVQQDSVSLYNIYTMTGATNMLIRANGDTVGIAVPVDTPLVIASNCRWIESGIVNYTLPKKMTASMNYGNTASCDDAAILTYNKKTYDITMP